MRDQSVRCGLRALRQKAGLQQQDLALRVGASRQAIGSIEAGGSIPSTELALKLARILDCRVEDIFSLTEENRPRDLKARVVSRSPSDARPTAATTDVRLMLGKVGARWVAHRMTGENEMNRAADATATTAGRRTEATVVSPLREVEDLELNLLIAGCDPALAILGSHVQDHGSRVRLHWIETTSGDALAALARGDVHVAGVHSAEEGSNRAAVVRALPGRAMRLVTLAAWQEGLVVAAGNPKRILEIADVAKRGVRLLARPSGSGAQALLDRLAKTARLRPQQFHVVGTGSGHVAAARTVALGVADVTIATRHAAEAFGLTFLPLSEERFDLVIPADRIEIASVRRVLDVLATPAFRRDLGALPGYGNSNTGRDAAV